MNCLDSVPACETVRLLWDRNRGGCFRLRLVPTLPVMIIIAPIFVLRFSRILPPLRSVLLTLLGFVLAMNIALWGLFNVQAAPVIIGANIARSSLIALFYFLPYLADRLLYPRFLGFCRPFPAIPT